MMIIRNLFKESIYETIEFDSIIGLNVGGFANGIGTK
jgi:hypothetical protein